MGCCGGESGSVPTAPSCPAALPTHTLLSPGLRYGPALSSQLQAHSWPHTGGSAPYLGRLPPFLPVLPATALIRPTADPHGGAALPPHCCCSWPWYSFVCLFGVRTTKKKVVIEHNVCGLGLARGLGRVSPRPL